MSRYVYPIFESLTGTYYGAPTSVKVVNERIKELVSFRREQASANNVKIDVRENRFKLAHPNDRLASVFIQVTHPCGKEENEHFVVHRSVIS